MDFNNIIGLAVSVYIMIEGILALTNVGLRGDFSKYTEESVKKYSKVFGVIFLIAGILFIGGFVFGLLPEKIGFDTLKFRWICYLGGLGLALLALFLRLAILKKKAK